MIKLRKKAKELGIKRYTVMKKQELEEAIERAKTEAKYYEIFCASCLEERNKQRLIDEKMYKEQKLGQMIRDLSMQYECPHREIAYDVDERICVHCGEVLSFEVNKEGDYFSQKIRKK